MATKSKAPQINAPLYVMTKTVKVGEDQHEVLNTFTVYKDGDGYTEREDGKDGFSKTRTVPTPATKIIQTNAITVIAVPTVPIKRGWAYSSQVDYTWDYDLTAEMFGKPVDLTRTDLVRFSNFINGLSIDRNAEKVEAY